MADIQQANSTTVSSNLCATSSSASTMIQNTESSLSVDVHEIQTQPGTDQSQNVKAQAYPKRRTNHESIYRYVSSPYFSSPSSYAMNKLLKPLRRVKVTAAVTNRTNMNNGKNQI